METPVIEVKNLNINYSADRRSKCQAVKDLSFKVLRGEIVGFIGPNGAGKTSTIKSLLNLIPVDSGECFISGIPTSNPKSRKSVGYMPETSYYPKYLKFCEFLHICAALSGIPRRERKACVQLATERTGMTPYLKMRLSGFSKGMLQQAGFTQALLHNPEILILDEPMSGLDPIARMRMRAMLSNLRSEGKTILFSSHELGEIEMVADRILLMNEGRLVFQGPIKELVGNEANLEQAFVRLLGEELPWAA